MNRNIRKWIAVGVAAMISIAGGGSAFAAKKQADTGVIKVGTNKALGTVTPYVGRTNGVFAKRGVTVEIVDFTDGSTLMEAFASGQLDVALLGIAPTAIWQGKGVPLSTAVALSTAVVLGVWSRWRRPKAGLSANQQSHAEQNRC